MPLCVPLARLLSGLRRRRAKRAEKDIERELSLHLELETRQNLERGMSPADAARAARATLGNAGLIREDVRDLWRWRWLDQLRQDLRCGARTLARGPGFAAMSVATLALTIGATTAIFSALHGILLRPLPVEEPDRLVRILDIGYVGELLELRERARTLDVSAYVPPDDRTLTGLDEPLRVSVVPITGDLPARLGRTPALGPGFRLDDERPGAAPAALLSDSLWRQRFGADPAVVGRTLPLDGVAHEVRGVMPPDFDFPSAGVDLWVPMTVDAASPVGLWARTAFLVGRLRPGVSLEAAADEMRALGPRFAGLFPWRMPDDYGTRVTLRTWREDRLGEVRPMLLLLLAAVAAVWLIGAVNLTNLQQVRAAARRHELALRVALGAGRGRVVRQLLTESALVCLLGGAAGLAVAWAGVPALVALLPADVPRADGIRVDGVVLGFTAVLSVVTALAAGTLPALRAARAGEEAARSGSRGSVVGTTGRGLDLFVTVETAAAVTLAIAAALLARSLASQLAVDVGLSPERRVVAEVAPSAARHPDDAARLGFYTALEQRLRALPFVRTVGLSTVFEPFGAGFGFSVFTIEGRPNPATEGGEWPSTDLRTAVSADYLTALGVPIVEGRAFTEADSSGAQRVVLVSRRLAETWWPGESRGRPAHPVPGQSGRRRSLAYRGRRGGGRPLAGTRGRGGHDAVSAPGPAPRRHRRDVRDRPRRRRPGPGHRQPAGGGRLARRGDAGQPHPCAGRRHGAGRQPPALHDDSGAGVRRPRRIPGDDRHLRRRRLRRRAPASRHRHPARPRRDPRRRPHALRVPRAGVRRRRRRHRRAGRGRPDVVALIPAPWRQPVGPRHVPGGPRAVRAARGLAAYVPARRATALNPATVLRSE